MKEPLDEYPTGQLLPGTKYVTVRKLGRGGMGVVYEVVKEPGIRGAAKIMSARLARRPESVQRFYDEAARVAKLRHPNIVQIIDYDRLSDGTPFFVMELLEGKTLGQLLRDLKGRGVRPEHAFAIQTQLLAGLHHAHTVRVDERVRDARRAPIVHRDIKPDNIFLHLPRIDGAEPSVKILDLGISAAAGEANEKHFVGSYPWAAPEQFKLEPATPQTDLYAAGLVLYTMLAGKNPFEDFESHHQFMLAHVVEPPPPLPDWVPKEVSQLVMSALAKDPAHRPASAYEFSAKLWSLQFVRRGKEVGRDMNTTTPTLGTLADEFHRTAEESGKVPALDAAAVAAAPIDDDTLLGPPVEVSPETHARGLAKPLGVCGTIPEAELSDLPPPPSVQKKLAEQAELARAVTRTQEPSAPASPSETGAGGGAAGSPSAEAASTAGVAQSLAPSAPARRRTWRSVYYAGAVGLVGGLACGLVIMRGHSGPSARVDMAAGTPSVAASVAPSVATVSAAQVEWKGAAAVAAPASSASSPLEQRAESPSAAPVALSPAPAPSPASVPVGAPPRAATPKGGKVDDAPLSSLLDRSFDAPDGASSAPAKPAKSSPRAKRAGKGAEKGDGAKSDWLEPWDGDNGGAK